MVVQKEKTPKPNGSDVFTIGGDKRDRTADLLNAIDGADMLIHFLTFYFILSYPSQITWFSCKIRIIANFFSFFLQFS